jgi:DNA topoisomerase IB
MSRLRRADPSLPGFTRQRAGKGFVYYDDAGQRIADIEVLERIEHARSKTARKRAISRACQEVAHYLGNTPAVCRKSYIDPRVVDRYRAGVSIAETLSSIGEDADTAASAIHGAIEEAVLELLEDSPNAVAEAA